MPLKMVENLEIPPRLLPVLNGLSGDLLAEKKNRWAIQMSFREHGEDIPVSQITRKSLNGKNVVILIHGLMADENIFSPLRQFLNKNFAVLSIRYNTGRHISQNGRSLAKLLDQLDEQLGEQRYTLIGHSMGGLVIRSACYYAQKRESPWLSRVPYIFLIAVPNSGAALEKLNHLTASTLQTINRWHLGTIGKIMHFRSNGIKDLRLGLMLEKDWRFSKTKHPVKRSSVPPLDGTHYHIILGSLHRNEKSFVSRLIGDGLVSQTSGIAKNLEHVSTVRIFPGMGHNSILRDRRLFRYVKNALKSEL